MTSSASGLKIKVNPRAVTVVLDRPEARNALSHAMISVLHNVCADLERNPRPLVLRSSGSIFAAGADISELLQRDSSAALLGINSTLFSRIHQLPLPTIAVVNGAAIGGGAELAYACDYRLGTSGASFSNPEPSLGIMAAAGATHRLAALIGEGIAKDVLLFGRSLNAEDALRSGLLNRIVAESNVDEAVEELLQRIAGSSALALQLTKTTLHAPLAAHPAIDTVAQAVLFDQPEKHKRMTAFLERKKRHAHPH